MTHFHLGRVLLALAVAFVATVAHSQSYPSRAVRMIVPYAPGGAPDIVARAVGKSLTSNLGQAFIVENRPGAGGMSAAETVARATPDGSLLLFSDIQQLAINPYLFAKLPYDPARDFAPVTLAATMPLYVVARSSLGIMNLADLSAYAKANPNKLTYGSSGIGSIHHITMESLLAALGIKVLHIPYKGSGQSVPAFAGGDTDLVVSAYPALIPFIKSGMAKLLAVTTLNRSGLTPEVPAASETIPGFDFSSEMGVVVPSGTPPATINLLSKQIAAAINDPEMVQRLGAIGMVPVGTSPDGYAENIRNNLKKFERAVKISGAKAQ